MSNFVTENKTLLWFKTESSFMEMSKDFSKVMEMVIKGTRSNKNIIKIREAAAPFQAREDCLHQLLKCDRRITEPEWHPYELKETMMSRES